MKQNGGYINYKKLLCAFFASLLLFIPTIRDGIHINKDVDFTFIWISFELGSGLHYCDVCIWCGMIRVVDSVGLGDKWLRIVI